jgi:DNA-binding response OmpR family regulator
MKDHSEHKNILIVDDEPYIRLIIRKVLEKEGYNIWEAANITDGLELARQNPDLILLDIRLGEENGYDLCKKIKRDKISQRTPIIIMSALDTDRHIQEGIKAGGNAFLFKPFKLKELKKIVKDSFEKFSSI